MSMLGEKNLAIGGWWPPFIMDTRNFDFGLSEKASHELNKVVYKATLQYSKECADAHGRMIETIQSFLKRHKI